MSRFFSPIYSFLFLSLVLLTLLVVAIVFEGKEISLKSGYILKLFDINLILKAENTNSELKKDSVVQIIESTEVLEEKIENDTTNIKIDTLKILNALKPLQIDKNFQSRIEYPTSGKETLKTFFEALKNARNQSMHIVYFGDSQIEEDRFSGFMRENLQKHFGGSGCGWLPFMPVAQWIYPKVSYSDNWVKWSCFASSPKAGEIYGPMGQSFVFDSNKGKGKVTIKCNANVSPNVCLFNKIKLFYGFAKELILLHYYSGGKKILSDTLNGGSCFNVKEFPVSSTEETTFEFEGFESPVFYGFSLESFGNGVYVDNVALRGSSGTFFHLLHSEALRLFFLQQNVKLVVLQFGGNAMPMIDSEEKAVQYAQYISGQIKTIKRIYPQVSILFVGPSDMCVNQNGEMQTHPFLERVNEELKKVVLSNNCAYFDMYQAMGGRNSMLIWVEKNYAAKDYIHFSPAGARKMASLIYYSLMKDYSDYVENNL
ncbi:MAG: hypothetical protein KatS3mg027_0847 [Bacteroidia bacterium]|nr:MAG: hypothetical protein KatS3mg027_0847 [Bacteroidia bacterium]